MLPSIAPVTAPIPEIPLPMCVACFFPASGDALADTCPVVSIHMLSGGPFLPRYRQNDVNDLMLTSPANDRSAFVNLPYLQGRRTTEAQSGAFPSE